MADLSEAPFIPAAGGPTYEEMIAERRRWLDGRSSKRLVHLAGYLALDANALAPIKTMLHGFSFRTILRGGSIPDNPIVKHVVGQHLFQLLGLQTALDKAAIADAERRDVPYPASTIILRGGTMNATVRENVNPHVDDATSSLTKLRYGLTPFGPNTRYPLGDYTQDMVNKISGDLLPDIAVPPEPEFFEAEQFGATLLAPMVLFSEQTLHAAPAASRGVRLFGTVDVTPADPERFEV